MMNQKGGRAKTHWNSGNLADEMEKENHEKRSAKDAVLTVLLCVLICVGCALVPWGIGWLVTRLLTIPFLQIVAEWIIGFALILLLAAFFYPGKEK